MPTNGPGQRHTAVAGIEITHGQVVVDDGFVGTAFKVTQPDRFVRPADYPTIEVGEEYEIQVGGTLEAPLTGALAGAVVGSRVWITPATNALDDVSSAGALPVGVVTDIDIGRTPDVAIINSNAWQAFLPGGV